MILKGIGLLQWMALKGGSYKTDDDAAEEQVMLAEATVSVAEILFRDHNDALGFISHSLFMPLHTSRPTSSMVRIAARSERKNVRQYRSPNDLACEWYANSYRRPD
jgi:hypothetical protein